VLSPTQSQIQTVLRSFLINILPDGVNVVQGQDNMVAEPQVSDFVVMTPIRRTRLETNIDAFADAPFIGSINGSIMTVTAVGFGEIVVGAPVLGIGVLYGTVVTQLGPNTDGGVGTYYVNPPQTIGANAGIGELNIGGTAISGSGIVLAAGISTKLQQTDVVIQLDVHGPNASDNAQVISTVLRDDYACEFFTASGYAVQPLFTEDPRQVPFINAEQQYEYRWMVEAHLQASQIVTLPQAFAEALVIGLINVDVVYPPLSDGIGVSPIGGSGFVQSGVN
jgi:hypothetical protein